MVPHYDQGKETGKVRWQRMRLLSSLLFAGFLRVFEWIVGTWSNIVRRWNNEVFCDTIGSLKIYRHS